MHADKLTRLQTWYSRSLLRRRNLVKQLEDATLDKLDMQSLDAIRRNWNCPISVASQDSTLIELFEHLKSLFAP